MVQTTVVTVVLEKWLDLGYILKIKLIEFPDGLEIGYKNSRGEEHDTFMVSSIRQNRNSY